MRPKNIELTMTTYRLTPADALRLGALAIEQGWKLRPTRSNTITIASAASLIVISLSEQRASIEARGPAAIGFVESVRAALTKVVEVRS